MLRAPTAADYGETDQSCCQTRRVAGRLMSVVRKTNEATEQLWRKSGNEELINGGGGGEGQSMASVSPDQHKMFQCSMRQISSAAKEYGEILVFPSG